MGETRVDLHHLLEDLRDAYPGDVEETILTEVVANSVDSGAHRITFQTDPAAATVTIVDDGSGMQRRNLARYHDLATSTKTRGAGIGFAGVGIKLALLISTEVITETRRGTTQAATEWSLAGRHRAPWRWLREVPNLVGPRGTAVQLKLANPLSPLLDPGFVEATLCRHFEPLLDARFAEILLPLYREPVTFEVNGRSVRFEPAAMAECAPLAVRLERKRKPSAVGWLARDVVPLPEGQRGLAISTYGKVIKRGWDWLGVTPRQPECVAGMIEVPALAECLTLNKGDFIRTGPRGAKYLAYRRAIQEAVMRQLAGWGDREEPDDQAQRRAARPVEKDLEEVLVDLADDFPMLASLVDTRSGGQRRLAIGRESGAQAGSALMVAEQTGALPNGAASVSPESDEPPAVPPSPSTLPQGGDGGSRRPARYGLAIHYETRQGHPELSRLADTIVFVNDAHPAYRRALASRAEGYHLALCVALALAPLAADLRGHHDFITAFLVRWGAALPGGSRRRRPGAESRP